MGRRFRAEQTGREEEELEEEELEEEELEEEERRGGGMYIHVCVPANREACLQATRKDRPLPLGGYADARGTW